ncbi:hypothetical protein [Lacticaseibacillus yichunensis]|uniref:Uncharacterized protein n=1 Tax=Lacticaseibacillus yichunensis TaxID=2486015 RepID=A0ABW4CPI6_9LACO|nr:hypothetical protein [Lacticaseibacillus yichunensis]
MAHLAIERPGRLSVSDLLGEAQLGKDAEARGMVGQPTWGGCLMAHLAIECTHQLDDPTMRAAEAQLKDAEPSV